MPGNNVVKFFGDILSVLQVLTTISCFFQVLHKPNDSGSMALKEGGDRESCAEIGCCQCPKLGLWPMRKKKMKLASHVRIYSANHTCIHTVPI